jgi:hypothetical protein
MTRTPAQSKPASARSPPWPVAEQSFRHRVRASFLPRSMSDEGALSPGPGSAVTQKEGHLGNHGGEAVDRAAGWCSRARTSGPPAAGASLRRPRPWQWSVAITTFVLARWPGGLFGRLVGLASGAARIQHT